MMRSSGIIRRIDDIGRLVVPRNVRMELGIREGDPFEIFSTDDGVLFKKYEPRDMVESRLKELEVAIRENDYLPRKDELLKKLRELEQLVKEDTE